MMTRLSAAVFLAIVAFVAPGCAVWPSYDAGKVNLAKYDRLLIVPFEASPSAPQFTAERNKVLCAKIAEHVKCCPTGFREVADKPDKSPKELILTGTAVDYDPGNPIARMMLIGLGPASFHLKVRLQDGATGEVLSESDVKSLFVFGGLIGGVVQEPTFVNDLGRAIGNGVTQARDRRE